MLVVHPRGSLWLEPLASPLLDRVNKVGMYLLEQAAREEGEREKKRENAENSERKAE